MPKLQIVARIDYDHEKQCYYLAEFDAKIDKDAPSIVSKKSPRKPGFQRECERSSS